MKRTRVPGLPRCEFCYYPAPLRPATDGPHPAMVCELCFVSDALRASTDPNTNNVLTQVNFAANAVLDQMGAFDDAEGIT